MALKEEVLGQFLGDEKFPIEWSSETEKPVSYTHLTLPTIYSV